jgi:hypothetical protein
MTKLVLIGLIYSVVLVPQTKVDWVTQMKNAPIYDVRAYGAKGNGVADDTAAIGRTMDAVKLAGGGSVFFPKGTYRYVNPTIGYYTNKLTFTNEASNITVFGTGDGSVIQFENVTSDGSGLGMTFAHPRSGFNVVCTTLAPFNCTTGDIPPYWGGFPVIKRFQNATVGSKTITLVTASDASAFTAGMDVFLESGTAGPATGNPPWHFEYNQVVSASSGTGVITLAAPLDDSYDSTDAAWPPFIAIMPVLPKNILIRDLKITHTNSQGILFHPGSVRNIVFDRVTFLGTGPNSGWWNGRTESMTIRNSVIDYLGSDIGDSGYNFTVDHNIFKNSPIRTLQGAGSLRNYRITNNDISMSSTACCDNGIAISSVMTPSRPATKVEISGNLIRLPPQQYGCGIYVSGINDALVTGNTITGPGVAGGGQAGVCAGYSNNTRITNNLVNLGAGNGSIGVLVDNADGPITGVAVEGNTFKVAAFGVKILGATTQATIGCNLTMGGAAAISDGATGTVNQCGGGGGSTGQGYYTNGPGSATAAVTNLANHQFCGSFTIQADLQIGHIVIPINTASAGNGIDVGIYNATGAIIAHTGPLNIPWTGYPWPSKPICARNSSSELEACGAAGSPTGKFRIPAGKNYFCYLQGDTQFKMAAYANGAGIGGIADLGLNSDPSNCLPGADGSCSPYVLRPQIGPIDYPGIANYPIVILTP